MLAIEVYHPNLSVPSHTLRVEMEPCLNEVGYLRKLYQEQYMQLVQNPKAVPVLKMRTIELTKSIEFPECKKAFLAENLRVFFSLVGNISVFDQLGTAMKDLAALRQDYELGSNQLRKYYELRDQERVTTFKQKLNKQLTNNHRYFEVC
jgi:hypothetical protein